QQPVAEGGAQNAHVERGLRVIRDVVEQDALDAGRIAHQELTVEHALCFPDGMFVSDRWNRGERIFVHRAKRGKKRKSLRGGFGSGKLGGRVAARAAATGFAIASFSAMREPPRTATDVPSAPRPAATLAMCRSLGGAAALVFGSWRRHVISSIQRDRET